MYYLRGEVITLTRRLLFNPGRDLVNIFIQLSQAHTKATNKNPGYRKASGVFIWLTKAIMHFTKP
jgi:hypothetical protein